MHLMAAVMGLLGVLNAALPAHADEASALREVKEAFAAARAKDETAAYEAVRKAVADSGFIALKSGTQHAALELAYISASKSKDFDRAHDFSSRATALPEQDAQDWSNRLYSAAQIADAGDEAICISSSVRIWGVNAVGLSSDAIRRAYRDLKPAQFAEARKQMLVALYEARWRPVDGSSASQLWLALSLSLQESHEATKAAQVVALVDDPSDLIAMHADWRYKPLLKAPYFESDPHAVARSKIKDLRHRVDVNPRSLAVLLLLTHSLLTSREDQEVLEITSQAERKIDADPSAPPFDDVDKNYPWILNEKSDALRHLGRFEDAETELRRALKLPHPVDSVSQALNLASLLCELDRPAEALQLLPKMADASEYGKTQIAMVELSAATEQADATSVQQNLAYLRDHLQISPDTYQRALLVAGEFDAAEAFLLSRLADSELRTEALLGLQIYAERKLPPKGQAWHAAQEKLKMTPSIRKAVALVGSIGHYTWRYD